MPSLISSNNASEFSLHNGVTSIDITTLPGYQNVPLNCPLWKRGLIEKKNAHLLEQATKELEVRLADEERWRDVPAWKKTLILEKERKNKEMADGLTAEERKEREEDAKRLQAMPEWKRKLVLQKRGEMQ